MTFSETLCKVRNIIPETNDLEGTCCMCGKHTTTGFKKKFGGNFSTADYVSTGDVICPECHYLLDNSNEYRRTMYYLSNDEFVKFKKKEAKDIIFNLPDKPFYLYLTDTWQKIGWIRMNLVYNQSTKNNIKILKDYDIIECNLENLKSLYEFIKSLRDLKISKKDLESGHFEMYNYRKLVEEFSNIEARNILKKVKSYVGNPIYDLVLYIAD